MFDKKLDGNKIHRIKLNSDNGADCLVALKNNIPKCYIIKKS